MKATLNGLNITYRFHMAGSDSVTLLLHGWGGNLNSFRGLENSLAQNGQSVLTLDFPGFGGSDFPKENSTLEDYYKIVAELVENLHITKLNIVAHSFGGRIALLLASRRKEIVQKLVLVDSAGLKPKYSIKKSLKIFHYKFLKKLKNAGIIKRDLSSYGSSDYRAMPDKLKPVFNNIVNTDLTYTLKEITCPTIIVWGKDDKSTPYYMAKKLNKGIKDSAVITFDGGHFAYLQNANKFSIIVNNFLKETDDEHF